MRKVLKYTISSAIILIIIFSCREKLVNSSAFFPQPGSVVDIDNLPSHIEHRFITTSDDIKISSFYLNIPNSDRTIIYFHGNAGNASQRLGIANKLWQLGMNVLLVDYRGYGLSEGKISESGMYVDAESSLDYLIDDLSVPLNDIIVIGRSIGSAAAIDLAQNKNIAGLILISPLSSGSDVAKKSNIVSANVIVGKAFNSIKKIENVNSPILIIHGAKDIILPIEMGKKLQQKAIVDCEFIELKGAGHNDIIYRDETTFYNHIQTFITRIYNDRN